MGTVRFEQRLDKIDKQGKAPIRLVYQISGQRKYYPTTLKCIPENWNKEEQKAYYIDKKTAKRLTPDINYEKYLAGVEVRDLNSKLHDYLKDVSDIEKRFCLNKIIYTPQMVIEAMNEMNQPLSKKDKPENSIITFITMFVKESSGTHKAGTLKVYTGLAAHLTAFESLNGKKALFEKIDISFLRAFQSFLSENRRMNNITAAKQISTLKTLLNYARTIYKIPVNPDYRDYKVARKDSDFEVITLTNDEFLTLYTYDLTDNKKLTQVRDVFCFSCATGLRYSDLVQLKWEHIRNNIIRITASKTGQRLEIPLNPFSAAIIEKYNGKLRPLPIISNQKTNEYLKELCKLAEIDTPIEVTREYGIKRVSTIYKKYELISIHTGRKTFTTLSLEKGIAAQEVMSITGHTTYKSFKRYVEITSKRKQTVMEQAWGSVKLTNLKAV